MSARAAPKVKWETEAAMVAAFSDHVRRAQRPDPKKPWVNRGYVGQPWIVYPETGGWDIVLVRECDGFQIGVEAKLSLNADVLVQALGSRKGSGSTGPDVWAVLVPDYAAVNGMAILARHLGIAIITARSARPPSEQEARWEYGNHDAHFDPDLPRVDDGSFSYGPGSWPERCPDHRIKLPDWVPDVAAGVPAPTMLTDWKIRAIKIAIILEKRGWVTRTDFKSLRIDMTRWTQSRWLVPMENRPKCWCAGNRTPDFRRQHPVNFVQIEADIAKWLPANISVNPDQSPSLFGAAA